MAFKFTDNWAIGKIYELQISLCIFFIYSFFLFWEKFQYMPGWPQTCYVTEDDTELMIPTPLSKNNDYKY